MVATEQIAQEQVARSRKTHDVFNQTPPLAGYNLFSSDNALIDAYRRVGPSWALQQVTDFGELLGTPETIALGTLANENLPVLRTHDRFGNRIDEVEFHPAWHQLMSLAVRNGLHCLPWQEERDGAHVARAVLMMLDSQNENGHGCPISMTYSVVPALKKTPELAEQWLPKLCSRAYDPSFRPASEKTGVLMGMAMTEKQGGSDVRANTTRAVPAGSPGPGQMYRITGHKWFCSAPMCDAFLVLAQAPGGLSCFLVPRWTPEAVRNNFFIQRLKNKMGNKSNASSEIEFDDALGWLVGEEGRGVPTIIEMVNHTRLDCVISSVGLMRQSLVQALHHATHRSAFGKKLFDQPIMMNVLADLSIESEAATILMMRLADAYDKRGDKNEDAFRRIATAVSKYWVCKRTPAMVYEALECHGGNGFIEESPMPRLFRESALNSIWEGSGNVMCLDVLRAMKHEPDSVEALIAEIEIGTSESAALKRFAAKVKNELSAAATAKSEANARILVEHLALALQGSLMIRFAPQAVADAFCSTRLDGEWGHVFGTLPESAKVSEILERARPN